MDFYDTERRLKLAFERLENDASILPENKVAIREFVQTKKLEGVGAFRQLKLLSTLQQLAKNTGMPFKKMESTDAKALLSHYIGNGLSDETEHDYGVITKMFFRFINNSEQGETPHVIRWLRVKKPKKKLQKSDLITAEELGALIAAADVTRKKAFIVTLYESGARIGELLGLKIKDVQHDEMGVQLSLTGKTGPRTVRCITASPILGEYLNSHPKRSNPDAPLFFVGNCETMGYTTAREMLVQLFKKAEVSLEKAHFHLFRHSRAAETKRFMPEDYQRRYFGWSQGSAMPSRYGALDSTDIDNCLLSAYGKAKQNAATPEFISRLCDRCHKENMPSSVYCTICGWEMGVKLPKIEEDAALNRLFVTLKTNPKRIAELTAIMTLLDAAPKEARTEMLQSLINWGDLQFSRQAPDAWKT